MRKYKRQSDPGKKNIIFSEVNNNIDNASVANDTIREVHENCQHLTPHYLYASSSSLRMRRLCHVTANRQLISGLLRRVCTAPFPTTRPIQFPVRRLTNAPCYEPMLMMQAIAATTYRSSFRSIYDNSTARQKRSSPS